MVTASDPVALVDASLLPTRLLLFAADVRPPFLPPFLPAAAFFDLVFAGFFDFPLAMLLMFLEPAYFIRSYDGMYAIVFLYNNYLKLLYNYIKNNLYNFKQHFSNVQETI